MRERGSQEGFGNRSGMPLSQGQPSDWPQGFTRSPGGDQEQFLSGFSWGPGCGFYFMSRAMLYFWLGSALLQLETKLLEVYSDGLEEDNLGGGLLVMIGGLLSVAAVFGLLIWAGKVARRRRWHILRWRDFDHFRKDESSWNSYGRVGWTLMVILLIVGLVEGVMEGLSSGGS